MERAALRDRLEDMLSFTAVARALSFADAARELGISASALSRRISRLEGALGTALLRRTTRHVSLTEAGTLYLERCTDVLTRVEDAEALVSGLAGEPRGRLRVAVPNLFGQLQVAPLLPDFMRRYPRIDLEFSFMDRYVDLVQEGFDVAIRIGTLADSSLVVRRLATNHRILCAAPGYLKGRRPLTRPEDLAQHACLYFSLLAEGQTWNLQRGNERVAARGRPVLVADNAEALRQAALGGCGVTVLATFLVAEDLRAGRLVKVLDGWSVADTGIFAVHPPGRLVPSKVRAFVSFLAERYAGTPPWERLPAKRAGT
ncbi:LysR family transcriptional regulator [Pyxidicoccus xibeiensis]|uniref:LysR family transcriptional regulator n=1 Tax=Pyxidicoccus xibeiensis TaxID=2906759 RepID=UPI0020A7FF52|nr:LysR family transcriptional regulator [Pyxidicoccus xibeiensis]MCP3141241.1 LysR family transcriptional regulator [Pyxidicoccus xibeiensis]